ncbi:hypothetical protein BV22DRAFT_1132528 [Leucogyrophana mollusca]|uniref:Uncharacterized protein n=1 Tax=Leucogyrophana mollusca TaxID=85980 RepID=A0ACB8B7F4_9AGAM|nr:hypothetical protein BV22DRAFT_1132528 [Leucogyrophana mollusca]
MALVRKNTNNKIGELELTFTRAFCRGGNLKAMIERQADLPQVLEELKPIMKQFYDADFRGTLLNDLLALGAQESHSTEPTTDNKPLQVLPDDWYHRLLARINQDSAPLRFCSHKSPVPSTIPLNPFVQDRDAIRKDGVIFKASSRAKGDSFIIFRAIGCDHFKAGHISRAFLHACPTAEGDLLQEFFLGVEEFRELSPQDSAFDPYRRYPLIEARLFNDQTSPTVIKASDIISHCATCPYRSEELSANCRVILSLNRKVLDSSWERQKHGNIA